MSFHSLVPISEEEALGAPRAPPGLEPISREEALGGAPSAPPGLVPISPQEALTPRTFAEAMPPDVAARNLRWKAMIDREAESLFGRSGLKAVYHGLKLGNASILDLFSKITRLGEKAAPYFGGEIPPEAADWFAELAAKQAPKLEELDPGLQAQIMRGLGSAPGAIAQYVTGGRALKSGTAGFAAIEALHASDQGWREIVKQGAKGAMLGKIFGAAGPLKRGQRAGALAGLGGATAAVEGGTPQDIAAGAATLGILGATAGRGRYGMRELHRKTPEPEVIPEPAPPRLMLPAPEKPPVVSPEAVTKPVVSPEKPIRVTQAAKEPWQMTREELAAAEKRESTSDKDIAIEIFGPEAAARYERLQRRANSTTDLKRADEASAQIGEMESRLTPEQETRLFGIGEKGRSAEEYGVFRRALEQLDDESPQALGASLRWAISRAGQETNPAKMSPPERIAYAQFREAQRIAQERGFDTSIVSAAAIKSAAARFADPADAEFMLRRFFRPTEPTPQGEQALIPGVAPVTPRERAEVKGAKPLTGEGAPFGETALGDVSGRGQLDLVERARVMAKVMEEYAPKRRKRPGPKRTKPETLSDWVRAHGGLKDPGGEIKDISERHRVRGGLFDKKGMHPDDAALRAWEAGFFPEFPADRPTMNEFFEAVRDDFSGVYKRYHPGDERLLEQQEHEARLVEAADRLGINVSGREEADIIRDINRKYKALPPSMQGIKELGSGGPESRKLMAGYTRRAQQVLDYFAEREPFVRYAPLGKLPQKKEFLTARYRALGRIGKVNKIARGFDKTFRKATDADKQAAYEYLTTRDADAGTIMNPTIRAHAVAVKRDIDAVGKALVARGILPKESYEKYKGEYLPRVYLKHLLGEGGIGDIGRRLSERGYLKARKDLSREERAILGEVTDPGYLAARGFSLPLRDVAIQDFLQNIADNPAWVFPEAMVKWQGKNVSVLWLDRWAKEIKDRLPYYPEGAAKTTAENVVIDMEAQMGPALEALGRLPADYRQIPDSAKYGPLRGLPVRKEIYDDLVGGAAWAMKSDTVMESLLGTGGAGTRLTQWWKMSKVAMNPPTQVRNFVSNGILLQISGVPMHRIPDLWIQAATEMARDGVHWQVAKRYGVAEATFAANELRQIETAFLRLKAQGGSPIARMKHMAGVAAKASGDLYQLSEGLNKTAKIIYEMKRGASAADAALAAHEAVFDYSLIPPWVRYARNSPVGMPFVTFYYKAAPNILNTAVTAPWRFLPYYLVPAVLAESMKGQYDINEKEYKALMKALPQWLQDQGSVWLIPWKDQHGRWQFLNMGYIMPWSLFTESKGAIERGDPQQVFSNTGIFGGPIPQAVMALNTNVDPFTKRPIWDDDEPPAQRLEKALTYLWALGAPTWITDRGFAGHMERAINEEVDRYGKPTLTKTQAALRLFGLNVYPIEPGKSRQVNLIRMRAKIREAQSRMRYDLKDKSLTARQRSQIRQEYRGWIDHLRQTMQDYAKESELPARLQ